MQKRAASYETHTPPPKQGILNLKILLLTFNNTDTQNIPPHSEHTFIVKQIECKKSDYFPELKKTAKFAEDNGCELMVTLPPKSQLDILLPMLNAMPNQDMATSLVTAFNSSENKCASEDNRVTTMLQLLTGELICEFRNDLRIYPTKLISYLPEKFFEYPITYLKILINASRAGYKIVPVCTESKNLQFTEKKLPASRFCIGELFKTLLPFIQKRLCPRNFQKEKLKELLMHPKSFLKYLLKENATPGALAMAAGTGIFIGTLPIFSMHTVVIIYISIKLRLNKMLAVNMQHICMPPLVPIACIEIGHYMLNGKWLKTANIETMFKELDSRILEWILGSLILAPIHALVFAGITYVIAVAVRSKQAKNKFKKIKIEQE